jgi:hypothetical protein
VSLRVPAFKLRARSSERVTSQGKKHDKKTRATMMMPNTPNTYLL